MLQGDSQRKQGLIRSSSMKVLIRSQVHDASVVALSHKSIILVSLSGREPAIMNYNLYAYHFCRRLFIVLGREFQVIKMSNLCE